MPPYIEQEVLSVVTAETREEIESSVNLCNCTLLLGLLEMAYWLSSSKMLVTYIFMSYFVGGIETTSCVFDLCNIHVFRIFHFTASVCMIATNYQS